MLRPQDVLLACKLHLLDRHEWTFAWMATELGISVGEIHNAQKRLRESGVLTQVRGHEVVAGRRLYELLAFAIPSLYYAEKGKIAQGLATGIQAPGLDGKFPEECGLDESAVWEWQAGKVRGESVTPVYPTVPDAASKDQKLYELFALVDVIRLGGAKERRLAREMLEKRIVKKDEE